MERSTSAHTFLHIVRLGAATSPNHSWFELGSQFHDRTVLPALGHFTTSNKRCTKYMILRAYGGGSRLQVHNCHKSGRSSTATPVSHSLPYQSLSHSPRRSCDLHPHRVGPSTTDSNSTFRSCLNAYGSIVATLNISQVPQPNGKTSPPLLDATRFTALN